MPKGDARPTGHCLNLRRDVTNCLLSHGKRSQDVRAWGQAPRPPALSLRSALWHCGGLSQLICTEFAGVPKLDAKAVAFSVKQYDFLQQEVCVCVCGV